MQEDRDSLSLHHAAATGQRETCLKLVSSCLDVNTVDELGWTPLMHAVRSGDSVLAQDLLKHGADVCICNLHNITAFTLAVLCCDEFLLEALFDCLSPADLRQSESNNALQVASARGLYTSVRWLLANTPAQINSISAVTGTTSLMFAVIGHHHRVVQLLLQFGADPSTINELGQDVFQLAGSSGDKTLMRLLQTDSSKNHVLTFDFLKSPSPEFKSIDPVYSANNLCLDVRGDLVLKNSPGRPVFKVCEDDLDFSPETDLEIKPMLSPSLRSVFLPSPQRVGSQLTQSWDSKPSCDYRLKGLLSPRFDPLLSTLTVSPTTQGRKRKRLQQGCSSRIKQLTKRRTKSVEDSDNCIDFDQLKPNGIDFPHLLLSLGLDEFLPIFKEQELDIWTFLTLTTEDLIGMGINNQESQKSILKSIEMLRKTQL